MEASDTLIGNKTYVIIIDCLFAMEQLLIAVVHTMTDQFSMQWQDDVC
jgi:hypothetical protein